jgi:ABC-type polysaccharide/polyol phosphate export permease
MSWSNRVRRIHRWTSAAFTVAVAIVTVVVLTGGGEPAQWVYFLPLVPLWILIPTGVWLFVLPYAGPSRRRVGQ